MFCNHQEEATIQIDKVLKSNARFSKFVIAKSELTKGRMILDLLAAPFQRIMKYPLLLSELLKRTPKHDADYALIEKAGKQLQSMVDVINSNKGYSDNLKRMLEINSRLVFVKSLKGFRLIKPGRQFIMDAPLLKISKYTQERHFYLFNDILLWTSPKSTKIKDLANLDDLSVEDISSENANGHRNAFRVERRDRIKSGAYTHYILIAQTPIIKKEFLKAIEAQNQKRATFALNKVVSETAVQTDDKVSPFARSFFAKQRVQLVGVVRVFKQIASADFKTIAITKAVTTKDLCSMYARKLVVAAGDVTFGAQLEEFDLYLFVNDQERLLSPDDRPLEIQLKLINEGVPMGSEHAGFKAVPRKAVPASVQHSLSTPAPTQPRDNKPAPPPEANASRSESMAPQPQRSETNAPQPQRSETNAPQPQRSETNAPQPQRSETNAPQPQRSETNAPQPQRSETNPPQPQRSETNAPQPQRSETNAPQPQRSETNAPQPQRSETNAPQPQRSETNAPQPQRSETNAPQPQRSETNARATVSEPRARGATEVLTVGAIREGWLLKRGAKRKNWQKRWFVLTRGEISYFTSNNKQNRKGQLLLSTAAVGRVADDKHPNWVTPLSLCYALLRTFSLKSSRPNALCCSI